MSATVAQLALDLLELPVSSRALLARKLIESLDGENDPGAESLWLEEAKKRSTEIAQGKDEGLPSEEVFREARARIKK